MARFAALLAGLPPTVPASTVNRLCASGLQAVVDAARAVTCGEGDLYIAGGVESMTRAPYRHEQARHRLRPRRQDVRHHHRRRASRIAKAIKQYGNHSMPETGDNVAKDFGVTRAGRRRVRPRLAAEIRHAPRRKAFTKGNSARSMLPGKRKDAPPEVFQADEHPRRDSTIESLAKLKPLLRRRRGHRRQLLGRQRRRRRAARRLEGVRAQERQKPIAHIRRAASRGRRAAHHGRRPGLRHPAGAAARESAARATWTSSRSTKPSPARCSAA